jgi:hypothetical protein
MAGASGPAAKRDGRGGGGPVVWHDAWSYGGRGSTQPAEACQRRRWAAVRTGEVVNMGEIEGGPGTGVAHDGGCYGPARDKQCRFVFKPIFFQLPWI